MITPEYIAESRAEFRELLQLSCMQLAAADQQFSTAEQQWFDNHFGPGAADGFIQQFATIDWGQINIRIQTLYANLTATEKEVLHTNGRIWFTELLSVDGIEQEEIAQLESLMALFLQAITEPAPSPVKELHSEEQQKQPIPQADSEPAPSPALELHSEQKEKAWPIKQIVICVLVGGLIGVTPAILRKIGGPIKELKEGAVEGYFGIETPKNNVAAQKEHKIDVSNIKMPKIPDNNLIKVGSDGIISVGDKPANEKGDVSKSKDNALANKSNPVLWEFKASGAVMRIPPAIGTDGTIYVYSGDHVFYALDGKTGAKKWEFKPPPYTKPGGRLSASPFNVKSSPAIGADGTVYIGAERFVYAIDGKTGKTKWKYDSDVSRTAQVRMFDSQHCCLRMFPDCSALPSKVSHQQVDEIQITPTPNRPGIRCGQFIQQLGLDGAVCCQVAGVCHQNQIRQMPLLRTGARCRFSNPKGVSPSY